MKIIVIGCGRVGRTLTEQLTDDGNDVTVVDEDSSRVSQVSIENDCMGVIGNGASYTMLMEAGIEEADLLIAVTDSDEVNLLCCLLAKKVGNCNTIARVRNPVYNEETDFIRQGLGLSMIINPELTAAEEIAKVLRFPQAIEIDSFGQGRVELIKFRIPENNVLAGTSLLELKNHVNTRVLICTVERGNEVLIPDGKFVLQAKDKISIIASTEDAVKFFAQINMNKNQIKDTMLVGGGTIAYYLAKNLEESGISVKILEERKERCEELAVLLPKTMILNGDGSDKEVLKEEGLLTASSFVALTQVDEENVLLSLHAKSKGREDIKVVTRVQHDNFNELMEALDMDTIIYPAGITADYILQFVRAKQNTRGESIRNLYKIVEGRAEAIEFVISEGDQNFTGKTLLELPIKPNVLVSCIIRDGEVIIPRGSDVLMPGDSVIIISASNHRLMDIRDIFR